MRAAEAMRQGAMQELTGKKADMQRKADIAAMDERRTLRILKTVGAATAVP